MFTAIFSRGWPFFSYTPSMKNGSMMSIMHSAAVLFPNGPLMRKNSGTPSSAPPPKHTSCRFVRLNAILLLTRERSLGTGT
jgi:hypothetical protein